MSEDKKVSGIRLKIVRCSEELSWYYDPDSDPTD